MIEAVQRVEVLESFLSLRTHIQEVTQLILKDSHLVCWIENSPNLPLNSVSMTMRQKVNLSLQLIEYLDDQDPRAILIWPGFVGASTPTIEALHALNEAKDTFKKSILGLRDAGISIKDQLLSQDIEKALTQRTSTTALTLKRMGLSRLHLKQCYRKIPILPFNPKKISWTWAHTRSIKRITVEEARTLLKQKKQIPSIQYQLALLEPLNKYEPLAIVQELAPHLRANIVFSNEAPHKRKMIKGPLPLFFPAEASTPTPEFQPPIDRCQKNLNRAIRSDVRLEATVFLPALRAHRYLKLKEEA